MSTDFSLPPVRKRPIGEIRIWFTSIGLSLGLIMIFGLLGIIFYNGLETFWPKKVYEFIIKPVEQNSTSEKYLATITRDQNRRDTTKKLAPDGSLPRIAEYQIFTGNKEAFGQAFRFIDKNTIVSQTEPENALVLERLEGGNALVLPTELKLANGSVIPADSDKFDSTLKELTDQADRTREQLLKIERDEIGSINQKIGHVRGEIKLLRASYDFKEENGTLTATEKPDGLLKNIDNPVEELHQQETRERQLSAEYEKFAQITAEIHNRENKNTLVYALGDGRVKELSTDKIVHFYAPNKLGFFGKLGVFCSRFWSFMSEDPREANTEGGIFPAIFGTFIMTVLMSALVTPIGVIAAIYLREYARQGALVQIVRICVNNLAGVPSIVFGVFGLGFFVYFVGGSIDELFFWKKLAVDNAPTFGTSGVLWASLTLALMTLPVVIVATEESLSAVPRGLREAALACGASKWQMIQRIILPSALPGVLTGLILAMARGAGEVAPLMLTGVVKLAPSLPLDWDAPFIHLERKFMHLGFHIYDVGFQSPDSEAAKPMVFATTLLLILLVVVMNLAAIIIRNHLRKKYQASSF